MYTEKCRQATANRQAYYKLTDKHKLTAESHRQAQTDRQTEENAAVPDHIWVFPTPGAPQISVSLRMVSPPPSRSSSPAQKVVTLGRLCSLSSNSTALWLTAGGMASPATTFTTSRASSTLSPVSGKENDTSVLPHSPFFFKVTKQNKTGKGTQA